MGLAAGKHVPGISRAEMMTPRRTIGLAGRAVQRKDEAWRREYTGQGSHPQTSPLQVSSVKTSVYVGLGSNLGNRPTYLAAGLAGLRERGLSVGPVSSLYLTEPDLRPAGSVDARGARGARTENGRAAGGRGGRGRRPPARHATGDGDGDHPWYVNCVAAIGGAPAAAELLRMCLDIERRHGRVRPAEDDRSVAGAGPRTLDLDILLVGAEVIDEPGLRVPHPRLDGRRFVLKPLAEIAPGVRHPVTGDTIGDLLDRLPAGEGVWLLAPPPEAGN